MMRDQVAEKILQVSVSGKFMAILDCLLDIEPRRTEPTIEAICVSSGCVLIQHHGDIGYNDVFDGSAADLFRNLQGVAEVAELTDEEWGWLINKVKVWS